jgi:hypothetical protein
MMVIIIIIIMTIIMTVSENSPKRYENRLSVQLTGRQPGLHRFSRPKKTTKFWGPKLERSVLVKIQVVSETNNRQPWKYNSARGGGKEQHYRIGQSRGVRTGAPQSLT